MQRKRNAFTLLAAVLASTGCGGGGGDEQEPSSTPVLHHVQGSVEGLGDSSLTLTLNGSEHLVVTGSTFTFTTGLQSGATWTVTIGAQPRGLRCTPETTSGTASFTSTVTITCAGMLAADLKTARAVIAQPGSLPSSRNAKSSTGSANLLAVEADGTTHAALTASAPVRVMYTALDPSGEHLYLALRTPWHSGDDPELAEFLAESACAIWRVTLDDDAVTCVVQHLWLQAMDELYRQAMSGNQKPIQFDASGSVYFAAAQFATACDGQSTCTASMVTPGGHAEIYRHDPTDGSTSKVIGFPDPSSERLGYFVVGSDGSLTHTSLSPEGPGTGALWRSVDGESTDLTLGEIDAHWFGVAAGSDAAVFTEVRFDLDSDYQQGLRLARLADDGSVLRTVLDTRLFGDMNPSLPTHTPVPVRITSLLDGRLYGLTLGSTPHGGRDRLGVFRLLPFDPIPLYEIDLFPAPPEDPGDGGWWIHLGRGHTPLHVSSSHALLVEAQDHPDLGRLEIVRAINLTDRSVRSLFTPDPSSGLRFTVTSWRPSGDRLYLTAVDEGRSVTQVGYIDLVALAANATDDAVLNLVDRPDIAVSATAEIDIEPLAAAADPAEEQAPTVTFQVDPSNPYSVSLDFSRAMDRASVEANLSIIDLDTAEVVESFKLWIGDDLHLVPDRTGLGDAAGEGFQPGHRYRISLGTDARTGTGQGLEGATSIDLVLDP